MEDRQTKQENDVDNLDSIELESNGDKTQFFLRSKEHNKTYETSLQQKIKEHQQIQLALKAIIEELE